MTSYDDVILVCYSYWDVGNRNSKMPGYNCGTPLVPNTIPQNFTKDKENQILISYGEILLKSNRSDNLSNYNKTYDCCYDLILRHSTKKKHIKITDHLTKAIKN